MGGARIGNRKPDQHSVRPPSESFEDRGGPCAKVVGEKKVKLADHRGSVSSDPRPVFPVGEDDGKDEQREDGPICAPCDMEQIVADDEEQAPYPNHLPSVYRPTRSEYLDHCVTHYPFRAWCKHCLQGRGK